MPIFNDVDVKEEYTSTRGSSKVMSTEVLAGLIQLVTRSKTGAISIPVEQFKEVTGWQAKTDGKNSLGGYVYSLNKVFTPEYGLHFGTETNGEDRVTVSFSEGHTVQKKRYFVSGVKEASKWADEVDKALPSGKIKEANISISEESNGIWVKYSNPYQKKGKKKA